MHFKISWANATISQIISLHVLTKPYLACTGRKSIATCANHISHMYNMCEPTITQNVSQLVLNKALTCQRAHNMHLQMCWTNPPIPAWTQYESHHVLTRPILCQRGQKMHLKMVYQTHPITTRKQNAFNASENTKCILTCVEKYQPMLAHEMTKPIPSQQTHDLHINLFSLNPTHDSEHSKCISPCVDQTLLLPAITKNVSYLDFARPLRNQRAHKHQISWTNSTQNKSKPANT